MKTPVELAISGMQTLHLQHRCRGGYRVKAKASYVDETLFGSPVGTKPPAPDFDPPWVQKPDRTRGVGTGTSPSQASLSKGSCETTPSRGSTPTLTPKKKNKYRLVSRSPSYCDESLFGSRPQGTSWEAAGMAKGDAAKLRALFWTPPATPRGDPSPRPRETPLRAIHPAGPTKSGSQAAADACELPAGGAGTPAPPRRGRSQSLTHLNTPSTGCPARTNGPPAPRPSTSGVTFRSPLVTPRARSVSASVPTTPRQSGATQKPKPPWK
ncbi:RBPJ-interacting and tubulin-associated protein 1 [Sciurus carolinensis]|uniref:RBPJ-interacting and tubulin-associated protein 1 n=1 Tax=Sciurus carolinensis TaxID=30640 RepID=UPI001FB2D322|nr:RBPJ-interacting and tubulin-associated protein 1 [Sciurus carolinensis]XP_047416550.1 RBPJ-interacting and tubulin-associated protein 1 [Sciurus carolinensis]